MKEPIWRPFLHSTGSAAAGFAALVCASWVDALVLGRVLGGQAVAAVGVLVPALTLVLGTALVAGIGGSVAANRLRGSGQRSQAEHIFSGSLVIAILIGATLALGAWLGRVELAALLAPPGPIATLLQQYLQVLVLCFPLQAAAVVLYYFARLTSPAAAMRGLWAGALVNIALDIGWVAGLGWGMAGAAAATVAAQVVQIGYLGLALRRDRGALWPRRPPVWYRIAGLGRALSGGLADGISEWSGGLVLLAVYGHLQLDGGAPAVTAFALLNLACLVYWFAAASAGEAVHALASYDVGRGRSVAPALRCGLLTVAALSAVQIVFWAAFGPDVWRWQLAGEAAPLTALPELWPPIAALFVLAGFNITAIAAATAAGQVRRALPLALLRALILPLVFVQLIAMMGGGVKVLWGLPLAEAVVLTINLALLWQQRRGRTRTENLAAAPLHSS